MVTWYATPKRYNAGTVFKITVQLDAGEYPPPLSALVNGLDAKQQLHNLTDRLAPLKKHYADTKTNTLDARTKYDAAIKEELDAQVELERYTQLVKDAQAVLDATNATFAQV